MNNELNIGLDLQNASFDQNAGTSVRGKALRLFVETSEHVTC